METKRLSTRRMILNMLKTTPEQKVSEISAQLQLTDMAVRRHLHALEAEGLVCYRLVKQAIGRPLKRYALTAKAEALFPKSYHSLALDLLDELGKQQRDKVRELFEQRMERMQRKYEPRMRGKRLDERIDELTNIQNTGGYMAEWEALEDGTYTLKEYNCPISLVANEYDEACGCELKLFENLLEARVERTECLSENGNKCTYIIRATKG